MSAKYADGGGFCLFALLMREDSNGQDLVVSAPWIDAKNRAHLAFVVDNLGYVLNEDDIRQIGAVVALAPDHFLVTSLNSLLSIEHTPAIITNTTFTDGNQHLRIKGGVVITSMRR